MGKYNDVLQLTKVQEIDYGEDYEQRMKYQIHDFHLFYAQISVCQHFVLNNKKFPEFEVPSNLIENTEQLYETCLKIRNKIFEIPDSPEGVYSIPDKYIPVWRELCNAPYKYSNEDFVGQLETERKHQLPHRIKDVYDHFDYKSNMQS